MQQIKKYKIALEEAKKKQTEIEKELKFILEKYYNEECAHCPQDIREKYLQKFLDN